jgi:hypothetical protein
MDSRKGHYGLENDETNLVVVVEFAGTKRFGQKISSESSPEPTCGKLRLQMYETTGGGLRRRF